MFYDTFSLLLDKAPVRHYRADLQTEIQAYHNVNYVSEAPHAATSLTGESLNKTHKSYQGIRDFLNQWLIPNSDPNKGWVFSMMEGLGPVAQACVALGTSLFVFMFCRISKLRVC